MPKDLKRWYGDGDLHFITTSCRRRLPLLHEPARYAIFLSVFEEVRKYYRFSVIGYVLMPEHVHLLMTEPEEGDPSRVMQSLKRRTARRVLASARQHFGEPRVDRFWEHRFYDFNVSTEKKRIEKLRYMHRNPVMRELVRSPEEWRWSSYRFYQYGEEGILKVEPIGGL